MLFFGTGIQMKKSNKVILTAIFLSAVSPTASKAQVAHDSISHPGSNDSIVSYKDGIYTNDTAASNDTTAYQAPAYYPERTGFWWRFRVFFRFGYYGDRYYRTHSEIYGPRTTGGPSTVGTNPTTSHPASHAITQTTGVTPNGRRKQQGGFGSTLHASKSSAHS